MAWEVNESGGRWMAATRGPGQRTTVGRGGGKLLLVLYSSREWSVEWRGGVTDSRGICSIPRLSGVVVLGFFLVRFRLGRKQSNGQEEERGGARSDGRTHGRPWSWSWAGGARELTGTIQRIYSTCCCYHCLLQLLMDTGAFTVRWPGSFFNYSASVHFPPLYCTLLLYTLTQ